MAAIAFWLCALLVPGSSSSPETHPFSIDDMLAMDRISEPEVSPDGKWVAFTVRVTDVEANRGRTDVWLAPVDGDGTAVRRLTTHEANDWSPRWTEGGRALVFLSTRSGSSQAWRIALDGGEPEPLTDLPLDVDNVRVFPGGKRLLVTMEVYPELATLEETAKRDAEKEASKVKARIYEQLLFRHWDGWEDGKRSHVFVLALDAGADGKRAAPVDLTRGMDGDAPTKPFGGSEELAISPDGNEVAFAMQMMTKDAAWSTDVDVYTVPADGSAAPRCVTADNEATDNQPAYSPDGRHLAWLAMERPGYESDRSRVVVLERSGGTKRVLAPEWDRSAGEIVWSDDGRRILTSADDLGNHAVFALELDGGQVALLAQQGYNTSPRPAGAWTIFLHDDLKSPAEIVAVEQAGQAGTPWRNVTRLNAAKVAAARTGDYEQFSFTGAKDETVYGYLVNPIDFAAGKRYPVAFLIHGGPQGSFGDHFHYRWNPQVYAGAGYAVVMIDFHGSTGYGQAFTDSIRGDWGGAPYEDLMKGLDHALATYPFLDGERVAALGASYGGYMINWIAGQTDRFRCLVNHDGNLDERMAYFDTEELWFPEWEHGIPWEDPEAYAKHNPIEHVKNWKTPMLVIHGANDYRVVDVQGMATFTALQRRGIPSKLLHFPDENHWVLKPQNSQLWHATVIDWIDRWTKAGAAGTRPAGAGR